MIGDKFNLGSLMKNAKKIQEIMKKTQEELAKIRVTGESGAGLVKVVLSAQHEVLQVHIDPELFKESQEVVQDLIKAAMNDAHQKVMQITQEQMLSAGSLFNNLPNPE